MEITATCGPGMEHVDALLGQAVVVPGPGDLELDEGLVLVAHFAVEDVRVAQSEGSDLLLETDRQAQVRSGQGSQIETK